MDRPSLHYLRSTSELSLWSSEVPLCCLCATPPVPIPALSPPPSFSALGAELGWESLGRADRDHSPSTRSTRPSQLLSHTCTHLSTALAEILPAPLLSLCRPARPRASSFIPFLIETRSEPEPSHTSSSLLIKFPFPSLVSSLLEDETWSSSTFQLIPLFHSPSLLPPQALLCQGSRFSH